MSMFSDPMPVTLGEPSGEPGYLFNDPLPVVIVGGGGSGAGSQGATGATGARGATGAGATGATGAGGGGSSSLLACMEYAPSSLAAYTTTSTSPVAIDATNLTISFIAPASGAVLVRLSGVMGEDNGVLTWTGYWCLLDHTSQSVVGKVRPIAAYESVWQPAITSMPFLLTGLTPGTTYQVDWGWFAYSGSLPKLSMHIVGATGTPTDYWACPANMEVWSA